MLCPGGWEVKISIAYNLPVVTFSFIYLTANYGMISGIAVGGVAGIVMLVLVGVTAVKKCRRPGPGNLPVEREEEDNYPPLLRGARAEPVEA